MVSKILFLSRWYPYPPNNGSKLRVYNILRGLSLHYKLSLLSFINENEASIDLHEMHSICQDVQTIPLRPYNPKSLKARLGHLSPTPSSIIDTYSPEMVQQLIRTISTWEPDLVIASQLSTAFYRSIFKFKPALFEEVEVGLFYDRYLNAKTLLGHLRNGLTWIKHRRYVVNLLRSFQSCTVVSDREMQLLLKLNPNIKNIEIIPNCIDIHEYRENEEISRSDTLIFTGSFAYYPNYEGMVWFIEKVFPKIQTQFPSIKLTITGNHGGRPIPPASNVTLTGLVEDVRPLIARARVSVVPIISGGGTRLKILEAMALHTPVVTTHKGAEGLDVTPGLNILTADTPEEFADNIIKLLNDPDMQHKLANSAYQLVQEKYEWSVVMPRFIDLVETTLNKYYAKG